MKKYKFLVTVTDVYKKVIEVESTSMIAAKAQLEEDLDACPIETMSNTLDSTIREIKLVKS